MMMGYDEIDLSAWLTLSFTPGIGGHKLTKLLSIDSPTNLINYSREQLQSIGFKPAQIKHLHSPSLPMVEQSLAWAEQGQNHILTLGCSNYPILLKEIASPPPILFVQGNPSVLSAPQVALVGSRNASREGLEAAKSFSYELSNQGYIVTSGLALGIDGYAHQGALQGSGKTIAVLGSGLSEVYPARHRKLAAKIAEQGALVSEFWPKAKPKPDHFPRRNRIISGLSTGVLVVEAAERSGSLITARYALEQGREVFALPGSIHNPTSRGCHTLIKSGAKLVDHSNDILEEIGALTKCTINHQPSLFEPQPEQEQLPFPAVLANVGGEATPVDVVAQRCQQPVHEIMMQLLELELQGFVTAVPGGYINKRRG